MQYVPLKAQTSQAVTEFLLHHPVPDDYEVRDLEIGVITIAPWTLYFDGSRTDKLSGAGIASPIHFSLSGIVPTIRLNTRL